MGLSHIGITSNKAADDLVKIGIKLHQTTHIPSVLPPKTILTNIKKKPQQLANKTKLTEIWILTGKKLKTNQ